MNLLKPYRDRIDALDDQIVDLLAERFGVIREVAVLKYEHGIPAVLQDRVDAVRERATERGEAKGVDPALMRDLYARLIRFSCDLEDEIMRDLRKKTGTGG